MRILSAAEIVARATAPLQNGVTVDLTGLDLREPLILDGRDLANLDFSGSTFHAPLRLRGARLHGLAWFHACRFEAAVDLTDAVFHNDLRAQDCLFAQGLAAARAEFRGVACFDRTRFDAPVSLDRLTCYGNLSLDHAVFRAPVSFQDSEFLGGIWCDSTDFRVRADFRGVEVHGRTWVRQAQLGKDDSGRKAALRQISSYGLQWV